MMFWNCITCRTKVKKIILQPTNLNVNLCLTIAIKRNLRFSLNTTVPEDDKANFEINDKTSTPMDDGMQFPS